MSKKVIERVELAVPDIVDERIDTLKAIFPDTVSEGKVDFDSLRTALGNEVDSQKERYSFTWAGKKDCIRLLQTPTRATLVPAESESVNFEDTGNIFIEGDNLEVLKLLYKSYFGRVKIIYIDPPYNRGGDFVYPDNYADPLDTYLRLTGQKDDEGNLLTSNPDTGGRYHSAWLSMMFPRLFLARQLLKDDGIILISIDDKEVHNLRLMMNEIFGEEAFIAQFVWKSRQNKDNRNVTGVSIDHEYILCYGKRLRGDERDITQYSNPDNDPRGDWTSANMVGLLPEDQRPNCHFDLINLKTGINYGKPPLGWRYDRNTMASLIEEDRILWPSSPKGRPRRKSFLSELKDEFTGYSSIVGEDIYTRNGTAEFESLFGQKIMDFPKPSQLLQDLIVQGGEQSEIVLDFFAGSCPLAQAVMELNRFDGCNRHYICVQLPEPLKSPKTLDDGTTIQTIADIGKERIRRVIKKLKDESTGKLELTNGDTPEDLGFRVFKLSESNIKPWVGVEGNEAESYIKQMELYADPLEEGWKLNNMVWEVAIKEGYSLNSTVEKLSSAEGNTVYRITDKDKEQSFYLCLDNTLTLDTAKSLELTRDDTFICRDVALTDELAANLALQCRLKII